MNTSYHEYCIQLFLAGKVLHLPWFFATLLPFTWVLIKMIINLVTHWSKHFWTFIIFLFQCSTLYCAALRLVSLYYWWYYPWEPLFQGSSWSSMTPTRWVGFIQIHLVFKRIWGSIASPLQPPKSFNPESTYDLGTHLFFDSCIFFLAFGLLH